MAHFQILSMKMSTDKSRDAHGTAQPYLYTDAKCSNKKSKNKKRDRVIYQQRMIQSLCKKAKVNPLTIRDLLVNISSQKI